MKSEDFYSSLYLRDRTYGLGGAYDARILSRIQRAFPNRSGRIRILDVGCGKGELLARLRSKLGPLGYSDIRLCGVDISEPALREAQAQGIEVKKADIDGNPLPFGDEAFDVVLCYHVIEHVLYTDELFLECRRVLKPGGTFIVETPNIAWLFNRFLLLFGMSPLCVESSARKNTYGVWFGPLKRHLGKFDVAGHVRAFTLPGLSDCAIANGFRVASAYGQDRVLGVFPSLARNIGLVLTKEEAEPAKEKEA